MTGTAYMYLGDLMEVEPDRTDFLQPKCQETEDYITGRFGWDHTLTNTSQPSLRYRADGRFQPCAGAGAVWSKARSVMQWSTLLAQFHPEAASEVI